MKLISAKEFINKFGLSAAKEVVSYKFFNPDYYYCHIHKQKSITIEATYSDKPNIIGAEWVKLSELRDAIK